MFRDVRSRSSASWLEPALALAAAFMVALALTMVLSGQERTPPVSGATEFSEAAATAGPPEARPLRAVAALPALQEPRRRTAARRLPPRRTATRRRPRSVLATSPAAPVHTSTPEPAARINTSTPAPAATVAPPASATPPPSAPRATDKSSSGFDSSDEFDISG